MSGVSEAPDVVAEAAKVIAKAEHRQDIRSTVAVIVLLVGLTLQALWILCGIGFLCWWMS